MEQQRGGTTSFDAAPSPPGGGTSPQAAKRDLSIELVHVTEAATLVCAPFLGKGDPDRVSEAAGGAMRAALDGSGLAGTVVLSPRHQTHLPHGMVIGGGDRKVDLGLYAVEGASQVARGHINSVSTVVAVEPGGFARLPAVAQVEKFVAGPAARGAIDLDDSIVAPILVDYRAGSPIAAPSQRGRAFAEPAF